MAVIVIAIVLVVNLGVRQLPTSWTSLDISANDYYSIGETTENVLKNLDQKFIFTRYGRQELKIL